MACPVCQNGTDNFGGFASPGAYRSQTCSCLSEDSIGDLSTPQADSLKREDMEELQQLKNMRGDITRLESAQAPVPCVGGQSCDIIPSVPLVARIAFLRNIYVTEAKKTADGKVGGAYWEEVDNGLEKIRKKYDNDATQISACFGLILDQDRRTYKEPDAIEETLDGLPLVTPEVDVV